MVRSLDAFRLFLGMPTYRTVMSDGREGQRVAAHWPCGCMASGATFMKLSLKTCERHRAQRTERALVSL